MKKTFFDLTRSDIEEYFTTVENAIRYYELGKQLKEKELKELSEFKAYDFFDYRILQYATNNATLHALIDRFQKEYRETYQLQINEDQRIIDHLKTLHHAN